MKKVLSVILLLTMCISVFIPQAAFAEEAYTKKVVDKKAELEEVIKWAKGKGLDVEIDFSKGDYNEIDIPKLKRQLQDLSAINSEIEINIDEESGQRRLAKNISSDVVVNSVDDRVVSKIVTKTCSGTASLDGANYNYKIYVYTDYDCLISANGSSTIESINNITSDAGQAYFIRDYDHDIGTEVGKTRTPHVK